MRPIIIVIICLICHQICPQQDEYEGKIIKEIIPVGFKRHKWEDIRDKLELKPGKKFTKEAINRDIRRLFDTGYFSEDISYKVEKCPQEPDKVILTIIVSEYLIVSDVIFSGIKSIPLSTFQNATLLKKGGYLNPRYLNDDKHIITQEYLKKGYHFVEVTYEIIQKEDEAVVKWLIREGPIVFVEDIKFCGNKSISSERIKQVIQTKERRKDILSIFFPPTPFVFTTLKSDIQKIKEFYGSEGFLDVFAGEAIFIEDLTFSLDKTKVCITIHIDEGERYTIRNISTTGNTVFGTDEITSWLSIKPGDYYSEENIKKDVAKIKMAYEKAGYVKTMIEHQKIIDLEKPVVDVIFQIQEQEIVYVGKINITGNKVTRDDVIRKRLFIHPADKFERKKLERSINKLRESRLFTPDGIKLNFTEPTPNVYNIEIDLTEGNTANIRFAGGYSSGYGIIGVFDYTQYNFDLFDLPENPWQIFTGEAFVGGGQYLRIQLSPGARKDTYALEFKEPYFLSRNYGAGFSLYKAFVLYQDWSEDRTGTMGLFEFRPSDYLTLSLIYSYFKSNIEITGEFVPTTIALSAGKYHITSLTPKLFYDTRDEFIIPKSGMITELSFKYAGGFLPANYDFTQFTFDWKNYFPVFDFNGAKHVLSLKTQFWVADEIGKSSIPIFEKFFAGGPGSVRGFAWRGLGPHEDDTPIGGDAYLVASLEYSIPILSDEFRFVIFYDAADLEPEFKDLALNRFRHTTGIGFSIVLPMLGYAKFSIYLGFPIVKQKGDRTQAITVEAGGLPF